MWRRSTISEVKARVDDEACPEDEDQADYEDQSWSRQSSRHVELLAAEAVAARPLPAGVWILGLVELAAAAPALLLLLFLLFFSPEARLRLALRPLLPIRCVPLTTLVPELTILADPMTLTIIVLASLLVRLGAVMVPPVLLMRCIGLRPFVPLLIVGVRPRLVGFVIVPLRSLRSICLSHVVVEASLVLVSKNLVRLADPLELRLVLCFHSVALPLGAVRMVLLRQLIEGLLYIGIWGTSSNSQHFVIIG